MKTWHKWMIVLIACAFCYTAGGFYAGGSTVAFRPLLTCLGILLATWMHL